MSGYTSNQIMWYILGHTSNLGDWDSKVSMREGQKLSGAELCQAQCKLKLISFDTFGLICLAWQVWLVLFGLVFLSLSSYFKLWYL